MAGTPGVTLTIKATEFPLVKEYMEELAVQLQGLITENERLEQRLAQAEKVIAAAQICYEYESFECYMGKLGAALDAALDEWEGK